jgi:hypothetical protein
MGKWRAPVSGPLPEVQLGAIGEVMLGTSARTGEVLAIRRDVDSTCAVPSIRFAGTTVKCIDEPTSTGPPEDRHVTAGSGASHVHVRRRPPGAGRVAVPIV